MPELPEVEIIKNNLSDYLIDKTFHSIEVFTNKLRYKIPHNLAESIKNQRVTNISRIAKYIIVDLENNYSLLKLDSKSLFFSDMLNNFSVCFMASSCDFSNNIACNNM